MEHETEETQEISLRLEQYDDIFSDFDIRPYSKRALSVDFLEEIKRAARDKTGDGLELIFFAPETERNPHHEATITERLGVHFKKHHLMLAQEKNRILKIGLMMVVLGVFSMIAATLIIFKDPTDSLLLSFLVVFLEPASWFLLWEGMDQLVFNSRSINPELSFYKKMTASHGHGHIHFKSY